ncbi:MAG: ATP-binding protein [Pseudohongiellaceae bacterium]
MKWIPRLSGIYNLRVALLAYVLIPVIVVLALAGSWSLRLLEQQVDERMQEDIELIARAIRLPLSHALERDRPGSIQQALDSAFSIDVVYGAYVYDENGEEIARSGLPEGTVQTSEAAALAAAGDRLGEFSQAGNEVIFSYFVPLTDTGGRISGLLQLTRRGSDFSDYITMVRQGFTLALSIALLLIAALVLLGHHRAIGQHLRRIARDMTRINVDQTDRRLREEGPAEMKVLAGGINDMLDRVNASQQEIAERQAHETELKLRLQESEKLAAIGQLASGIAHELGTPLSTVDGKAQQALRRDDLDRNLRNSLERVRQEAGRMERIIRQLLDFGRRNPLTRSTMDCGNLLRSVIEKLEQEIANRGVQVNMPHSSDAPPCVVQVDPIRFEQALSNLVANAVQACNSQIRIHWHSVPDGTIITVEDDGEGVAEKDLPYLFEPFFTTKAVGQGTGLGLSVAHAAVTDHGGHLEVARSEELGGACFTIYLPDHHRNPESPDE